METRINGWGERYAAAARAATQRAAAMVDSGELIACGFTNNVDRVVSLTPELLSALVNGAELDLDGPRVTRADSIRDLLTAIVQCVAAGEGIDLPVSDAETQEWLLGCVTGRLQLGGTGAQAANTLVRLGFPVLLHHTGLSPVQASVFDLSDRLLAATPEGPRPLADAINAADPTMWHVALEYPAGLRARVGGRVVTAPGPNRVIVSYDPVNAAFTLDPCFVQTLCRPAARVRRLLISGYSQIVVPGALERLLDESIAAIQAWRAARPDLLIHVELGAMPEPATLARVAETLAPRVDSIGLNIDELRDLLLVYDPQRAGRGNDLAGNLGALRQRLPTPRLSLHTRASCLTLTTRDPAVERDALLYAALVAATRARVGVYPTRADLAATLAESDIDREGVALPATLGLGDGIGRAGDAWLVVTPGIAVPRPAATVGLGDSFTAGVLAML